MSDPKVVCLVEHQAALSVSGLPCFTLNANCCTGDGWALSSLSALSSASLSHPRVIASLVIRWGFSVVAVMLTKIMAKPIKIRTCNITVLLDVNGRLQVASVEG